MTIVSFYASSGLTVVQDYHIAIFDMTTIVAISNMNSYIPYFLDIECFTKSGPETGKLCAFPFIYEGNTYEKCTAIDHDQFWCSTEVDHNGVHARGKWGNCGNECNLGKAFIFPESNL